MNEAATRNPLTAISPIDGRYEKSTAPLTAFYSEHALIKARVEVEVAYLKALANAGAAMPAAFSEKEIGFLDGLMLNFSEVDSAAIKQIERTTNHDVKAVEYWLREQLAANGLARWVEMIHFGLTSQDVNHTAIPLLMQRAFQTVMLPELKQMLAQLHTHAEAWKHLPLLARTHGQPASPTTLGKELAVFVERLGNQSRVLESIRFSAKFGGATGNLNAHVFVFPEVDWVAFANEFVVSLGLKRQLTTTQIEHYDTLAAHCDAWKRVNTILIDLCRDVWSYIGSSIFKLSVAQGEIGSSAMPHKVNPIDFENAEGNFMLANALLEFLAAKLPISRLQRDLTDSTVSRNIGVPMAHTLIALKSLQRGLAKITPDEAMLHTELEANYAVLAEAIQSQLRALNYPDPYNALKKLTRTGQRIDAQTLRTFVEQLNIAPEHKARMLALTPHNYLGILGTAC